VCLVPVVLLLDAVNWHRQRKGPGLADRGLSLSAFPRVESIMD
jgi:hypothetical protein